MKMEGYFIGIIRRFALYNIDIFIANPDNL